MDDIRLVCKKGTTLAIWPYFGFKPNERGELAESNPNYLSALQKKKVKT